MKYKIFFAFLSLIIFNSAFANSNTAKQITDTIVSPEVLVIDAEVAVILAPDDTVLSILTLKQNFADQIQFRRTGDTLTITSLRKKWLLGKGVVYVPASRIREVYIRKFSDVQSKQSLNVPKLVLSLHHLCLFRIVNSGNIEITGPYQKEMEYTKEMRPVKRIIPWVRASM